MEKPPVRLGFWLGVSAVVIVCGTFAGNRLIASVLSSSSELTPEENAATVTVVAYMDALLADDLATAYSLTCTKIQNDMTPTQFEAYQSDRGQISRYELVDVRVATSGSTLTAVVSTEMYGYNGASFGQNIAATKETAGWRVCE